MNTDASDSHTGTWPTGRQWTLNRGAATAEIAQAGATLRGYRIGDQWLTEPTDVTTTPAAGNGQLLVPWPNRIRDGRWELDGLPQQLPLTEPARHNASHGLLRGAEYQPAAGSAESVTLRAAIFPTGGYPFRLDHSVTWSLGEHGLSATHEVTHRASEGAPAAPVAIGAHPYLRVGDVPIRECTLQHSGRTRVLVDERLLPVGEIPVKGADDWRTPRVIGDVDLDTCWGDLSPDTDGLIRHRLRARDGRGVDLWAEPAFGQVQIFVTDRLPGRTASIAIEPMTAPPDAFNSGIGLRWLAPGESWILSWGVQPIGWS